MTPFFEFPAPSRASRRVSARSKASARVQIVDRRECLARPVVLQVESALEAKCFALLAARPDVLDIIEQPPAVRYQDPRGVGRWHTFDFLVALRSGSRLAIAVRPWERVQKRRFDDLLRLIAPQVPKSFADRVVLFTDADIPRPAVVPHAPATRLIERARTLGVTVDTALHFMTGA